MRCAEAWNSLSARLDGELTPLESAVLDAHLASCPTCTARSDELHRLHRLVRLRAAAAVPDLTGPILSALPAPPPPRRSQRWIPTLDWPRAALLVVAATQLVLALPLLLLAEDPGATTHIARELGAFNVAFAAGLLVVVWQPVRASGLLPLAAALAAAMVLGGVADVLSGSATVLTESHHLLELAGLSLLWVVARQRPVLPVHLATA